MISSYVKPISNQDFGPLNPRWDQVVSVLFVFRDLLVWEPKERRYIW